MNYTYYSIYKDKGLSERVSTFELQTFLDDQPELEAIGPFAYKENADFPFFRMNLLLANSPDSWNENDTSPEYTNLLTVVLGKVELGDERPFKLLQRIATRLDWELVDDHA